MPPLSTADVAVVIAALQRGVGSLGSWYQEIATRVKAELATGVYTMFDQGLIDNVKLLFYRESAPGQRFLSQAEQDAVAKYLAIIDQRGPDGKEAKPGDPWVKYVSGSAPPAPLPVPQPGAGAVVASDNVGGGHYAALLSGAVDLRANTVHDATQDGITDEYVGKVDINGWDGGLRFHQNENYAGTRLLPYMYFGGDSRATFSYAQYPEAAVIAQPTETYGQSLVIDGGFGQTGYDYITGAPLSRGILIAAQRSGQSIMFGVTPSRIIGGPVLNKVPLRVVSDGSANPIELVAGGIFGRVKLCDVGGQKVLCF
jgi:hypothetical protein